MMEITRDVVTDLWPVYEAGEASRDTRAVVEEFLAGDPEFARELRAAPGIEPPGVAVPPDAEASSLRRTRDLVRGNSWLRGLRLMSMVFTIFAVSRVISATSWNRVVIADLTLATICWVSYVLLLQRYRSRALRLAKRA